MKASCLSVTLETGRTHQIRVHLGTFGLGIIGDPIYRPRRKSIVNHELDVMIKDLDRILLHARRLGFEHPISGEILDFDRSPPVVFDRIFEQFGGEF